MVLEKGIANVVIKSTNIHPLESVEDGSPFADGGGTLWVYQSMISAYQADSTWHDILALNTVEQYEGSRYDWIEPTDDTPTSDEILDIILGVEE